MMISDTKNDERPLMLVFPFALLAHYLRCLVLCRELKKYFRIRFLNHPDYKQFVENEEFETFDCIFLDPVKAINGVKDFDLSWLKKKELEELFLAQQQAIVNSNALVVLGDYTPTLKMAAEFTGIRFISLMNGYMSKHYAGTRKISKSHPAYKLVRYLPVSVSSALTRYGERIAFLKLHQPFRMVRKKYKLYRCTSYLEELEGDLNLICDLPEIFPQKSLPANYQVIGPLYYDGGGGEIEHEFQPDLSKKTILVTMGSSGDWSGLAFLNQAHYSAYNILAIGDRNRILNGDHITHLPFIGMHTIFPKVQLMICHGGNGTLYQGLYYGVPTLVRTNHCEQEWNLDAFRAIGFAASVNNGYGHSHLLKLINANFDKRPTKELSRLIQQMRIWETKMPGIIHKLFQQTAKGQAKIQFVTTG